MANITRELALLRLENASLRSKLEDLTINDSACHLNYIKPINLFGEPNSVYSERRRSATFTDPFNADPDDHIAQYKQKMFIAAIPKYLREACMCKEQFASSRKIEKHSDDIYAIIQYPNETLRDYIVRFNRQKVEIPGCNADTAISAFRKGLKRDSDLYKELTKYSCKTMDDILAKAWAQIKWEEDEDQYYRPEPRGQDEGRDSRINDRRRADPYPPNDLYKPRETVNALKELGSTVKWPPKMRSPYHKRDRTKYCEFHKDHDHRTDNYITLRLEVIQGRGCDLWVHLPRGFPAGTVLAKGIISRWVVSAWVSGELRLLVLVIKGLFPIWVATFCWLKTEQHGCILPVRSQERTNCCYAFVVVDAIYAKLYLDGHDPLRGSEQELIDHLHKFYLPKFVKFEDGNLVVTSKGLENSYKNAFAYVKEKGLSAHSDYPFVGNYQNIADPAPTTGLKIFIGGYDYISDGDHAGVIAKLQHQPVTGSLLVGQRFRKWKAHMGVYHGLTPCELQELEKERETNQQLHFGFHGVTIVGNGLEDDHGITCARAHMARIGDIWDTSRLQGK
ncbi:hypothetical protein C2S52_013253 [Perilla frutescens var. hirtella]|nr:hypothetical protein C2S52_013253 [Perilla frutescens var. hirtella]